MFFKNVLVPYDESEHALSALHIAFGMVGGDPEATIHVVTVVAAGPLASPTLSSDAFDAPDNLSEELESDGIMGRRGLGALRGMLGSVSFGVLRSVDVPVLTVK